MLKATLQGLLAHKLRLALAALAVVLGVSFVSGTLVLSDTLNSTFDHLFQQTTAGIDVQVQGKSNGAGEAFDHPPFPDSVLPTVQSVSGVREAFGNVSREATFVGRDGTAIRNGGAPTLAFLWDPYADISPLHLRSGAPPGAGEVVMDVKTAGDHGFHIGDPVTVIVPQGPPQRMRISGITGFGDSDNLVGATIAAFDPSTGRHLLGADGEYDNIVVKAEDNVAADQLRGRVAAVLPASVEAVTGKTLAQQEQDQIAKGLSFISTFLLVFAGISLFVGSFIILNTFAILVTQRSRELALLRALGASRAQVMRSVLLGSLITGLIAAAVGVAFGVLIAKLLELLFNAIGFGITGTSLVFQARTPIVGLLVGTLVTMVASLVPAYRAARVPPVAALRDSVVAVSAVSLRRIAGGGALLVGGGAVLLLGLFVAASHKLLLTGLGALLVFLGVAVLAPAAVVPIVTLLAVPVRALRGAPGVLAEQNAMRNPRRTAATASALMIGIGLIGTFTVVAASSKDSINGIVDRTAKADFIITGKGLSPDVGVNTEVANRLRADPDVAVVSEVVGSRFRLRSGSIDETDPVIGVDPATVERVVAATVQRGAPITTLADGEIAVSEDAVTAHGWRLGDTIPVQLPAGPVHAQRVAAVYARNPLLSDYIISLSLMRTGVVRKLDDAVLVADARGTSPAAVQASLGRDIAGYPDVQVQTQADFKQSQGNQIDAILNLLTVLLVLAIVIALLGIVNTMALSIVERTRELGLVRALGMTRGQMRTMVRWETVMITLLGTFLGLAVGVAFGAALVRALSGQGIDTLDVAPGQLAGCVVVAFIAGLAAAIFPALRASRLNMLEAIATE